AADVAGVPARLTVVGESAAGRRFDGAVAPGTAVRIFTGAPMPDGSDTIVIQEDVDRDGDVITVREGAPAGTYVRKQGLDFARGEVLLATGRTLSAADAALAAAMNHATVSVRRRPLVALLANGDELVPPGTEPGPDQIIASNTVGVAAISRAAGADILDLGIAPDRPEAIEAAIARAIAAGADVLVTLGGASVGDHDLVKPTLEKSGVTLDFWKIAMRPGKPMMFGSRGPMRVLGLPGNPVSSLVCSLIYLKPLIGALLGRPDAGDPTIEAVLGKDLKANDQRQDHLRATLERTPDGRLVATPFVAQDSSILSLMSKAGCLVVRPALAPAAAAGDPCRIIPLDR
ncbi:MAG TPA: molybdopterin molybdotransferase MoeA, partial [Hyphomicrobiales bacterium]|nr:molybdopterin molybdotransferase MoeA [Hyphomicrobiales bacterium]